MIGAKWAPFEPMKRKLREASQRQLRVGEELRHALADIFGRGVLRDPDIADRSITVTQVQPSPDLKNATVYVMPLGGRDIDSLLKGLGRCAPFLTAEMCKRVYLKFAPRLRFELDTSFERVDRIESLLRSPEVVRDLDATDGEESQSDTDQETGTI